MKRLMLLCLFLVFYCSSPTEVGEIVVESSVIEKALLVENNLFYDIYYFIAEQGCLALLNWVPLFDESNLIKTFRKKSIPFKDITCGPDFKSNDIIVFHWWTKNMKDISDVKTITITL